MSNLIGSVRWNIDCGFCGCKLRDVCVEFFVVVVVVSLGVIGVLGVFSLVSVLCVICWFMLFVCVMCSICVSVEEVFGWVVVIFVI